MPGRSERTINYVILCVFSVIAVLPLIALVLVALHKQGQLVQGLGIPHHLNFRTFVYAWNEGDFRQYLKSSAIVACSTVAVSSVVCVLAGYAFGTMQFRGSTLLFYLILLGLVLPYEAEIIPMYYDFRSVSLINTRWALILPEIGFAIPFGVFWMRAFFRATPRSLIEAARIDGASSWNILRRVLLPNARPAILILAVITFMWTWNEFLLALVMITSDNLRTAPLGIAFFQDQHSTNISGLAAAGVIVAAPVVCVYLVLQRRFIQGVLSGAVRG